MRNRCNWFCMILVLFAAVSTSACDSCQQALKKVVEMEYDQRVNFNKYDFTGSTPQGVPSQLGWFVVRRQNPRKGNALNEFMAKYQAQMNGVLKGFDRVTFRGNLGLNHEAGMKAICGPTISN